METIEAMNKKEPIRVLHVLEALEAAGIEAFIMNTYRHIERDKVQFDFLVMRDVPEFYDAEIKNLGGRKYTINDLSSGHVLVRVIKESFRIRQFLNVHPYSVIHIHTCTPLRIFYLFAAKAGGVKMRIYHSHSGTVIDKSKRKVMVFNILKQFFPLVATHFFACSKSASRWMFPRRIQSAQNDKVIYNGIDTEKFRFNKKVREKARGELGIEGKYVLGHTGRFLEQKNHRFMIEIFEKVVKQNENSVLLLMGKGPLEDEMKELVREKKLEDKVCFMGIRSDVNEILQAIDCYIMPSFYEGLPVAAIEAQCAGLPCVFSDNITDEVVLIDAVSILSLSESAAEWAKHILNYRSYKRSDTVFDIETAGYEITRAYKTIQNYYTQE